MSENFNQTYDVRCWACGFTHPVPVRPQDRALAIQVMDHRRKFQGSSQLSLWFATYGDAKPEDVFPDLQGFDVDAYYDAMRA